MISITNKIAERPVTSAASESSVSVAIATYVSSAGPCDSLDDLSKKLKRLLSAILWQCLSAGEGRKKLDHRKPTAIPIRLCCKADY